MLECMKNFLFKTLNECFFALVNMILKGLVKEWKVQVFDRNIKMIQRLMFLELD